MKNEMNTDFQYCKIPYGEDVLAVLGSDGIREYGADKKGEISRRQHFHNLMEIAVCRWGIGEVMIDGRSYPYEQGDIMVIPQNCSHTIVSRKSTKSFWEFLYIKPSVFLEICYPEGNRKKERFLQDVEYRPFVKKGGDAACLIAEIGLIMDQFRLKEYEYQNCVKGLLFAVLMEIVKINRKDSEKPEFAEMSNMSGIRILGMAFEYIEENLEKELSVSEIAKAAYVSETYLRRLFAECCALSPAQYIKMVRIDAACKLLKQGDANINEVAYKVGYSNVSTFINNFKQITGKTPKQWNRK